MMSFERHPLLPSSKKLSILEREGGDSTPGVIGSSFLGVLELSCSNEIQADKAWSAYTRFSDILFLDQSRNLGAAACRVLLRDHGVTHLELPR
jgi:hypothetical protein